MYICKRYTVKDCEIRLKITSIYSVTCTALSTGYGCISYIYVMAFTSGLHYAGSDNSPYIHISLIKDEGQHRLYDRPGNDMYPNKGDLWKFTMRDFGFHGCVTKNQIRRVSIRSGGNDGWNIESIVTIARSRKYEIVTANFHVNRWIDGDGQPSHREFILTKA